MSERFRTHILRIDERLLLFSRATALPCWQEPYDGIPTRHVKFNLSALQRFHNIENNNYGEGQLDDMMEPRIKSYHPTDYEEINYQSSIWSWNYWEGSVRKANDVVFYVAACMLVVFTAQWAIHRFTDGIWPEERRLAREQREKAQRYKESKVRPRRHRPALLAPPRSAAFRRC